MLPASTPVHAGSANDDGGGGTVSGTGTGSAANGGSGGFAIGIGANDGRGGGAFCGFFSCNS